MEEKRLSMKIKIGTLPAGEIVIVKMSSRVRERVEMLRGSARSSVKGTQTVAMDFSVDLVRVSETVQKSGRNVRIAVCAVSLMTMETESPIVNARRVKRKMN